MLERGIQYAERARERNMKERFGTISKRITEGRRWATEPGGKPKKYHFKQRECTDQTPIDSSHHKAIQTTQLNPEGHKQGKNAWMWECD